LCSPDASLEAQDRGDPEGCGQDGDVPHFLVVSIVASVVLTVLLNVALRVSPRARHRLEAGVERAVDRSAVRADDPDRSSVRVVFPWKLILIGSLVLTALLNVLLALFR
jgi:hypothetical protein